MPFSLQYKPLVESEVPLSKTLVRPRNIYRINSYKYKDGKTKTLSGVETSIVFVIGISSEKVVSCLKLSLIKPEIFFKWLKKLMHTGITQETINNAKSLEDILVLDNKNGEKIFNQFVKSSRLYTQEPNPYRTYLLKNIKNIEEINIKKEILIRFSK
jgi:hypothetical protein